ncbi:MAG: hypothetical protein FJX59_18690 [Alphaproteobacteria bacterium]|nr:hypothetical protein [Alphaproteobacteria bacterium]
MTTSTTRRFETHQIVSLGDWCCANHLPFLEVVAASPEEIRTLATTVTCNWHRRCDGPLKRQLVSRHDLAEIAIDPIDLTETVPLLSAAELIVVCPSTYRALTLIAPIDCVIIEIVQPDAELYTGPLIYAAVLGHAYRRIVVSAAASGLGEVDQAINDAIAHCEANRPNRP